MPIDLWKSQLGSRSNRSSAHPSSLDSILFSLKTWEDIVYMVLLPCGCYESFVSFRAYVTLGVQLSICVSSPDRNTSARLEFFPTVPVSVLFCFWAGQTWLKFRTILSTKALCLFPVPAAVSIPLLLAWLTMLHSAPPIRLGSACSSSGFPLFTMICWKGVSFALRDGDRSDLTPLGDSPLLSPSLASASTSLRSTYESVESWYPHESFFAGHRSVCFYCELIFLLHTASSLGSLLSVVSVLTLLEGVPGLRLPLLFRSALLLALLPRLQRSVHCARALVLLAV